MFRTWISDRLQSSIQHEYDQKLEAFKAQLKAASEVELEQLKARLHMAANERSVRFSHLYEKTATTIEEVYRRLISFRDAVAHYTSIIEWSTDPSQGERRKLAGEKLQEFQEFYRPRRIYLPRALDDQIATFVNGLYRISIDFRRGVEEGGDFRRKLPADQDTWERAHKYINEESVELLKALEDAFQKELGLYRES